VHIFFSIVGHDVYLWSFQYVSMVCSRSGDRTFGQNTFGRQVVWENDVLVTGEKDVWATRHDFPFVQLLTVCM